MEAAKTGQPPAEEGTSGTGESRCRKTICRRRKALTVHEQIAALNGLIFNEPLLPDTERCNEDFLATHEGGEVYQVRADKAVSMAALRAHSNLAHAASTWPGLGLVGNRSDYYNPANSMLNLVLEKWIDPCHPMGYSLETGRIDMGKGNPISLAVVYGAVGRRAGLPVRMISAPAHFYVAFGDEIFVDVFEGGRKRSREDLELWIGQQFDPMMMRDEIDYIRTILSSSVKPEKIVVRAAANLIHIFSSRREYRKLLSVMRLAITIVPDNAEMLLKYAKVASMLDEYDLAIETLAKAQNFFMTTRAYSSVVETCKGFRKEFQMAKMLFLRHAAKRSFRPKGGQLQFRVGQLIVHRRYNYRGVIYGWDLKCEAGERWIEQMGVDELNDGRDQPFYKVLVDCRDRNNQSTYVAEENIIVVDESKKGAPPDMIQHSKVGFYFETYLTGGTCWHAKAQRYVPNALLKTQYPDD